jgi:hypothetical protein
VIVCNEVDHGLIKPVIVEQPIVPISGHQVEIGILASDLSGLSSFFLLLNDFQGGNKPAQAP